MAAWQRLEGLKAATAKPRSRRPSAVAKNAAEEAAAMLGLSFQEYRRALAAQEELDTVHGTRTAAKSGAANRTPLDGIYNLYVHKLYREGARIVNEQGDGNCLFRAIARQQFGDEGEYQRLRTLLKRYYKAVADDSDLTAINDLFLHHGESIVNDYIDDWSRSRTLDKLSADQKKRVDEIHEKLKPLPAGSVAGMNTSEKEKFIKLSKELRDIYHEGAPVITINTLDEKRAFLRRYADRIGDTAFWGGEADIYSLSLILNRIILIYPSNTTIRYDYSPPYFAAAADAVPIPPEQILLLFSGGNHYKSILAPEEMTVNEWIQELDADGVDIEDLREYGIAYRADRSPILGGNFLSGKPENSSTTTYLTSSYRGARRHRENWPHLVHLAFEAAQHMRPSTVNPEPPGTPFPRQRQRQRQGSAPRSAPESRRGSETRKTLHAVAEKLAAFAPRSVNVTSPSTAPSSASRRRPQPPPSVFGFPNPAYQSSGVRPPPAPRTTRRATPSPPGAFANPFFSLATRRNTAAAPKPAKAATPRVPGSPQKGWWARLLGRKGTRRNRVVPAPPVPRIPGIAQQIAAYQAPPPPGVPTLEQRAAAARRKQINNAALFGRRVEYFRSEAEKQRGLRGQPVPGARAPHHLPPMLRGPNGKLIPRPPLYPKPKGGRRVTHRKIEKGARSYFSS